MEHIFKGNSSAASLQAEGAVITKKVLSAVNTTSQAVFLQACYAHGLSITSLWDKVAINGTSAHSAFFQWYSDSVVHRTAWIDCNKPGCNPTCH